ncbi:MAG TPA: hypothetical protein GX730_04715 [Chloroflexi bacterium]|nr:hypothetical protein [Chloroflexota bacterium]
MQVALAFLGLCLPGLAWWLWLGDHDLDGGEALARIFAISASFITLVTLAFYTVRLSFTPLLLGLLLGLCFGLTLAGLIRRAKTAFNWTWLVALAVLGIFIIWRLWQAKDLVFPNWVDSQHHVLIIRKMIEAGGLPSTLEPYLPGPFYYHFAFHAVTALFSVLSGLAPEQSVLLLGQVMNACVGLSVYALAKAIGKDWRVGLLAAFFVTFVTKMPGYYLSWGRYTLLTGVLILPVAMGEIELLRNGTAKWWQTIGLFLLTVGTLLSHYLAAFLLAIYLVIIGLDWVIESIKNKKADWPAILTLAAPAFLGLLASTRWYIRVLRYSAEFVHKTINFPSAKLSFNQTQLDYLKYILGPVASYLLIGLAVTGLIWACFKSKWQPFALWSLILILFTLPLGFMILSFRSDYYGLILFLIISLLSSVCLIWFHDFLHNKLRKNKIITISFLILILACLGWGGYNNQDAVNDSTLLVLNDDVTALEWIKIYTPETARFFVNTTSWGYGLYRGVDGGGWILPSTGRWSLSPTMFYPYGAEQNISSTWTDWSKRASVITTCGIDFWELVEEANLSYVYTRLGTGGLQSEDLVNCAGLSRLYQGESVSMWLIEKP